MEFQEFDPEPEASRCGHPQLPAARRRTAHRLVPLFDIQRVNKIQLRVPCNGQAQTIQSPAALEYIELSPERGIGTAARNGREPMYGVAVFLKGSFEPVAVIKQGIVCQGRYETPVIQLA